MPETITAGPYGHADHLEAMRHALRSAERCHDMGVSGSANDWESAARKYARYCSTESLASIAASLRELVGIARADAEAAAQYRGKTEKAGA